MPIANPEQSQRNQNAQIPVHARRSIRHGLISLSLRCYCGLLHSLLLAGSIALALALPWAPAHADSLRLPAPQPAHFDTILQASTGSLQVFSYPGRQPIHIIDFPDLATQGRMFNRIVALVERIGIDHARVFDDNELSQFIRAVGKTEFTFAYGNDFLVSELVIFFNLAEHGGISLSPEEHALRNFLLEQGLMRERYRFLQAAHPNAVILSIPQTRNRQAEPIEPPVSSLARRTILMHEISHAEYYTNPNYRRWCRKFWREILAKPHKEAMFNFLLRAGYDPNNEELLINEAQAYLLHTPDPRAFSAELLGVSTADLELMRATFLQGYPDTSYK